MAELSSELTTYLSTVEDQKALRELYQQVSEQLQNLQQRSLTNPPLPVEIVSRP